MYAKPTSDPRHTKHSAPTLGSPFVAATSLSIAAMAQVSVLPTKELGNDLLSCETSGAYNLPSRSLVAMAEGWPKYRYDIFVSYSTRDADWVHQFYDDLVKEINRRGYRDIAPYLDKRRLTPGFTWDEALRAAVRESAILVPILSDRFFASDYCQREVGLFTEAQGLFSGETHRSRIVPIRLLRDAPPDHLLAQIQSQPFSVVRDEIFYQFEHETPEYKQAIVRTANTIVKILENLAPAQRASPEAHELVVERIVDFEPQKNRIGDAVALYEKRIPRDERYDHEMMVDLVRRHLSTEFGPTWMFHFLVATYIGRCVGMMICYEDIARNFAFIAYLATLNPQTPGKNPSAISGRLAEGLLEERRRLGLSSRPRFVFEVDHPALTKDWKERRHRLGRLKVFDRLAPFNALHVRALDLPYIQPTLEPPWTDTRKELLLCYAAPGLHESLPKPEAIELLTWVYMELYGDDIFEDPSTRAAYKTKMQELLDSVVQKLPEQIPLLRVREIEDR
jgi:hypothetical protein